MEQFLSEVDGFYLEKYLDEFLWMWKIEDVLFFTCLPSLGHTLERGSKTKWYVSWTEYKFIGVSCTEKEVREGKRLSSITSEQSEWNHR